MNNIQTYEEFINEGLITEGLLVDLKQKFHNWWNNFQNKDKVLRTLTNLANNGRFSMLIAYLAVITSYWFIPGEREWAKTFLVNPVLTPYWIMLVAQLASNILYYPLGKARAEHVRQKMLELNNRFRRNHRFLEDYRVMLGNKSNINACLNRMIADRLIEDKNFLNTADVTIIDVHGTIRDIENRRLPEDDSTHSSVDPYGEEDWNEPEGGNDPVEYQAELEENYRKMGALRKLAIMYDVVFRNITNNAFDFYDDENFKTHSRREKAEAEQEYNRLLNHLRIRNAEAQNNPNPMVVHPEDVEDRDYRARVEGGGELEDEPEEPIRKKFKDRIYGAVVPGFDMKPPEPRNR